jgi:uncharacterized lipoprotein YddW (UPF0748 family)
LHALSIIARRWLVLATVALAACGDTELPVPPPPIESVSAPAAAERRRGLWVLCEGSQRVLEHPERIAILLEDARDLGVTDLFVQVYRGGRAWFDSEQADAAPYRALVEANGRDTLAELVARAHEAGLRVHAWVNVLSLAGNTRAQILTDLGRVAVLVDSQGRSLLDYPGLDVPPPDRSYYRMGTPGVYLDPGAPGVREKLVAVFSELLARYPEFDGLHLDYIRYPDVLPFIPGSRFGVGLDFGYGAATRARFQAETGLVAKFGAGSSVANRWDDWRRDQITALVASVGAGAVAVSPDVKISAAVWSYADRAYLALGQDWRGWLAADLIDFAVPMAYTIDDRLLGYLVAGFAGLPQRERVWIGLGTWLFQKNPPRALEQLRLAAGADNGGDALFSWDSIAEAPALRAALAAKVPGDR